MSRRNKRLFFLAVLPVLAISGVAAWYNYEPIVEWRHVQSAKQVFSDVDDVTRVEIFRMNGEKEDRTTTPFTVRPYKKDYPTYGSVVLKDLQCEEFLAVWRKQKVAMKNQALCHYPTYGFRFYRGESLIRETSICWLCSNYFYLSMDGNYTWAGFDSTASDAKMLLSACDALLPYKRPATAEEAEEMKKMRQPAEAQTIPQSDPSD